MPWKDYAKNRSTSDGHQGYCRSCSSILARESEAKHAEAKRLRWAERLARTPDSEGVKLCRKCGETKQLLSFYAHRSTSDGRANYCMECQKAASKEWRKNNADRVKANNDRQQTDASLKQQKRSGHRRWWLALYGLTVDQYEALLAEQEGVCAICLKPESYIDSRTGNPRRLSVDHDHATGKVRGLLCGRCNRMLGYVGDDADALDRAAAYLRQDLAILGTPLKPLVGELLVAKESGVGQAVHLPLADPEEVGEQRGVVPDLLL